MPVEAGGPAPASPLAEDAGGASAPAKESAAAPSAAGAALAQELNQQNPVGHRSHLLGGGGGTRWEALATSILELEGSGPALCSGNLGS